MTSKGLPVPIPPTNLDSTSQSKEFWRGPTAFTRDRVTWLKHPNNFHEEMGFVEFLSLRKQGEL